MQLLIHYPLKDQNIRAIISECGGIYWFGIDIGKILGFTHSKFIHKYLENEKLLRISNVVRKSKVNSYILSFEQLIKILTSLPEHRQSKIFENWITAINDGSKKIYPSDPERLHKLLNLSPLHTVQCNVHFQTNENGGKGTTIPDILRAINLKISSVDRLCKTEEAMEQDIDGNKNCNTYEFGEIKQLINHSKTFVHDDVHSKKKYKFYAIDLNWKSKDMRPLNIFPFVSHDDNGTYLFVPYEMN